MRLESLEPRQEGLSHRIGSGFLRQALEAIKKMVENLGLDEQFGGFGVGSLDEKIAGDFHLSDPRSDHEKNEKVVVILLLHGEANVVLHGIQFLAQSEPISLLGEVGNVLTSGEDILADIEFFREIQDVAPVIFGGLAILRLDGDMAVGNKHADLEGKMFAEGRGDWHHGADEFGPVWLEMLIHRRKKLPGGWKRKRFHKYGGAHVFPIERGESGKSQTP